MFPKKKKKSLKENGVFKFDHENNEKKKKNKIK